MKTKNLLLIMFAIVASILCSHAIENLRISVQASNVVLSWPSLTNENFIVEYRELLTTNTPWTSLASNYPAKAGTNWTTFTHSNSVVYPPPDTNGGGGGSFGGPPGFNSATAANADEEKLSLEDLLPYPWNPRYQQIQSSALMSAQTLNAEGGGESESVTSYTPRSMGFYRVVRTGISLWGISNGMTLAGNVRQPIEIGITATPVLASIYVSGDTTQALTVAGMELSGFDPTGRLDNIEFLWNTPLASNGTYHIFVGAEVGTTTTLPARKYSLSVSNSIWVPDAYNWAGDFIEIQAQSIHVGGTYQVDIYNDTNSHITTVTGTNDGQGFIIFGGGKGFRVPNTDGSGNRKPSSFYTVVITTASAGLGLAASTASMTNFVWVEPKWPTTGTGFTQFEIAYMPVFGDPSLGGSSAVLLQSMIQVVEGAAEARAGDLGVYRGGSQTRLN